ncbi:RES family NAD+ phosphorylase [Shimia sp.]|uniref:RES family NAD+ phosphorylase n=1 Tax=Shimia sp. TaxID=1954381 RepID=UPI00329981CE
MTHPAPTHPLDESVFEDVFLQELDSWFTADIACCDQCYEKFLKEWPAANSADDCEFQKNQIQLDSFYDGSRINAFYTLEQFERLARDLDCPRCSGKLGYTLYPYNFPFDIPEGFEKNVEEISTLAQDTPFLLLKNELASEVLNTLGSLAAETATSEIKSSMFRARALTGLKNFEFEQFDFAAPEYVSEGRYNHAGKPALYLGDSKETCFHELRQSECAIAEISLEADMKVLDLVSPYDSHGADTDLLNALIFSALLSTPQDNHGYQKPAYVFSRFVADCARTFGFDAIRYPSTRVSEGSYNLVVLNRDFSIGRKSKMRSLCVFDGKRSRTIEL